MDPQTLAFLKRISKTLLIFFLWLSLTCIFAIKGDNAFIQQKISTGNILFYVWLFCSLAMLFVIFKKMWGKNILAKQGDKYTE